MDSTCGNDDTYMAVWTSALTAVDRGAALCLAWIWREATDPDQEHSLPVFAATPGTKDYDKLQLLVVLGSRRPAPGAAGQPK
jgi:hypothetical protein